MRCLALCLLAALAVVGVANGQASTCLAPVVNLYGRALCATSCYTSFCRCLHQTDNADNILMSTAGEVDMDGIGCFKNYRGSCELLASCTSALIECSNDIASSTCKVPLRAAIVGFAVDGTYPLTAPHRVSCDWSGCDIFNSTFTLFGLQKCMWNTTYRDRVCVNPVWFRGTLVIGQNTFQVSYDDLYASRLRSAIQTDLQSLFPGLTVVIQSLIGSATALYVDFAVSAITGNAVLDSGIRAGQATFDWLVQIRVFFALPLLRWNYFGPKLFRSQSDSCFSFSGRIIPYAAVHENPINLDFVGRNVSSCVHAGFGPVLRIVFTDGNALRPFNYEFGFRDLVFDGRNLDAGSVDLSESFSATGTATPYCQANDTVLTVWLISSAMSFRVGELLCLHRYPAKIGNPPPAITVWSSSTDVSVLARTLLTVWQTMGAGTTVQLTYGQLGSFPLETYSTFPAFQTRLNQVVTGNTGIFVADPCNAFRSTADLSFATGNNIVVLAGNYDGIGCTNPEALVAFNGVRFMVNQSDVIVTDSSIDPAILTHPDTRTTTIGFPDPSGRAARKVLERYDAYRFDRQPRNCTGPGTFQPANSIWMDPMEEGVLRFNGICGVTECCIAEFCSTAIWAGDTGCTLPMVPRGGVFTIVLRQGAVTVSTGVLAVINFFSHTHASFTGLETTAGIELRATVWTNQNFCYQLRCINTIVNLTIYKLAQFGPTTVCNPPVATRSIFFTFYWFSVYGWVDFIFGSTSPVFVRPATPVLPCAAIVVNFVDNTPMLFANFRPFDSSPGTVEGALLMSNGSIAGTPVSPLPDTASVGTIRDFCRAWAENDFYDDIVIARLAAASQCFQCPSVNVRVMPQGLFQIFSWGFPWYNRFYGETGNRRQICFSTQGRTQRSSNWGRRCCYNRANSRLIPDYPTTVVASNGFFSSPLFALEPILGSITDSTPNTICCKLPNANPSTCRFYRGRRDPGVGTSSPFSRPSDCSVSWRVPPPRGWGTGDPQCTSFDGTDFECNFWGEAIWARCDGWTVHISAVPVTPGALATIINGVVVFEGNDTVAVLRDPTTGEANITMNGEVVVVNETGSNFLSIIVDITAENQTIVRIISEATHEVTIEIFPSFFSVSTTPSRNCTGRCSGLLGNCDGDPTNDLVSLDGTVQLPVNADGAAIYNQIVRSYLVTDRNQSIFDLPVELPPNGTFVPVFFTPALLGTCPPACQSNPGCCLDASVAGVQFATQSSAPALILIAEAVNQTIPLVGFNFPPEIFLTPYIAVLLGVPIETTITATDSDGIQNFTIDACTNGNATCTEVPLAGNQTKRFLLQTTADSNFTITVTATDGLGRTTVAFIEIVSLPTPPLEANEVEFVFRLSGTGPWGGAVIFALRNFVADDLANIINTFFGLNRRQVNTTGVIPNVTTGADIVMTGVLDLTAGITNNSVLTERVQVTVSVAGASLVEATARVQALLAQATLVLPTTAVALAALVPNATLGTGVAPPASGASAVHATIWTTLLLAAATLLMM